METFGRLGTTFSTLCVEKPLLHAPFSLSLSLSLYTMLFRKRESCQRLLAKNAIFELPAATAKSRVQVYRKKAPQGRARPLTATLGYYKHEADKSRTTRLLRCVHENRRKKEKFIVYRPVSSSHTHGTQTTRISDETSVAPHKIETIDGRHQLRPAVFTRTVPIKLAGNEGRIVVHIPTAETCDVPRPENKKRKHFFLCVFRSPPSTLAPLAAVWRAFRPSGGT